MSRTKKTPRSIAQNIVGTSGVAELERAELERAGLAIVSKATIEHIITELTQQCPQVILISTPPPTQG